MFLLEVTQPCRYCLWKVSGWVGGGSPSESRITSVRLDDDPTRNFPQVGYSCCAMLSKALLAWLHRPFGGLDARGAEVSRLWVRTLSSPARDVPNTALPAMKSITNDGPGSVPCFSCCTLLLQCKSAVNQVQLSGSSCWLLWCAPVNLPLNIKIEPNGF